MTSFGDWRGRIDTLVDDIRTSVRAALAAALTSGDARAIDRPVGQGVGDLTFGLDAPAEACIDRWLLEHAARGPLSVLTEDRGWRHVGPDPSRPGATRDLDGFAHGGPRIALDPVDGTRNLMADLRSAWTVVSFAPPGDGAPRIADLTAGIVSELPTSRARTFRTFAAEGLDCAVSERDAERGATLHDAPVRVDDDARADNGYFPFFRYAPDQRPALAELEARFFARIAEREGADLRTVYDDQYISSAGQLVLILSGTYRMLVDARALLAARSGAPTVTSKPYDVGGAIVVARAAGAVVTGADGSELSFPIDAETPVHLAMYANRATWTRLAPHWLAVVNDASRS